MISLRSVVLGVFCCAGVLLVSGCGGGGGLSGPNSQTQAGLGTLVVRVSGSGDNALVTLDDVVRRPVQSGRATFYNVAPGRHFVEARTQSIGLPGETLTVEIVADKTLTISLSTSAFAPPVSNAP